MEGAGWRSTWSRGSLVPSPQLQGGLRGSEGSKELALLGSGGCGSAMKLICTNLEIPPRLWHRLSLFCVPVALGVKLGTCVRTGWHRGKAKGQQSQGVTETHRLGSSPSSTCRVTLGLYFLSLSPHLETEDITESTSQACCKNSPGTVYVSPSTHVHKRYCWVCIWRVSSAWAVSVHLSPSPVGCIVSLSLFCRWGY